MSCSGPCNCPIQPCPTRAITWLPRIAFGLVLAGYGVNHYRFLDSFIPFVQSPFQAMPAVASLMGWLAYVLPLLMIVGGVLFAVKQLHCLAKSCVLASLAGIIAWGGVGVLLGDANAGPAMMPAIQNAAMLLILYYVVKKMCCWGSSCGTGLCACGKGGSCTCGLKK